MLEYLRNRRGQSATSGLFKVVASALVLAVAACETPLSPELALALSELGVEFRAVRGSSTPLTQTVTVSNAGGGRLGPVSCPEVPAAWLTCTVSNGNIVTLTAHPAGLTQSPPAVVVPLTAPGASGTTNLVVDLKVEQPVLTLSAGTVTFSATEGSATTSPSVVNLSITNTGAGTLANLGAISCLPNPATPRVSCSVNQASGALAVTVDPTGLAPGTHVFPVSVSSPNSAVSQTFSVALNVGALPRIALSSRTLHFQAVRGSTATQSQTVTVTNSGGGTLGAISCNNPVTWVTCSVSGSTLTFTLNASGLSASPTAATFNVSAAGAANSPQTVTVTLSLEQPLLILSTNTATFDAVEGALESTPASQVVLVGNAGAGTILNLGSITCTPQLGAPISCTPIPGAGISVSVNPQTLLAGTHVFPVTVRASNAPNTQTLAVVVTVSGRARVGLSPSVVTFTTPPGSTGQLTQTVDVINLGEGTLGTITCDPNPEPWVTCLVSGQQLEITVTVDGLTTNQTTEIEVRAANAPNDPATLTVNVLVQAAQTMGLSTNALAFSASTGGGATVPPGTVTTPASADVTVSNTSAGTLAQLGTITCQAASVRVSCGVDAATGIVTFTVDPVGVVPGTYNLTANISASAASNSPQAVTITLTVTP